MADIQSTGACHLLYYSKGLYHEKNKKLNLFITTSLILYTVTIVALGVLTAAFLDFADFSHKYTQNLRNAIANQHECMKHKDPICSDGKYYKGE